MTLANPETGREVRLYMDANFGVLPGWELLDQDDEQVLVALAELNTQTVTSVESTGAALVINLGRRQLWIDGAPNAVTVASPWWTGASAHRIGPKRRANVTDDRPADR